jgi:cysteine desulfurase
MPIRTYFDHNATTPLLPKISEELIKIMQDAFGNASSIHWAGRKPKQILRETRQKLAQFLGCHPTEILFTSGASESNNTVIRSLLELRSYYPGLSGRRTIISSNVEHPSIQSTLSYYENQGLIDWVTFDISKSGRIDLQKFEQLLSSDVLLVSIMGANNETGILFPIEQMAKLAKEKGILFHSDMTQVFGKLPIPLENIDYISFSAHKAYALKGCGVLWVKKGSPFVPLIKGGSQERYRRAGTENILAIASLGLALDQLINLKPELIHSLKSLQAYFESKVTEKISGVAITHQDVPRLPNTTHLVIDGIDGESLLMSLDLKGYAVSTGAACSSGSSEPSPILINLGFTPEQAQMSLRVSFGIRNTFSEVDRFLEDLSSVASHLRSVRESPCEF